MVCHALTFDHRHPFADRDQVAALHERGVLLSVDRDKLHDPSQKSTRQTNPDNPLHSRLRHAWDWISGHL